MIVLQMESCSNLPTFFEQFQYATTRLQTLIPSLNESIISSLRSLPVSTRDKPDEEVFAGLPTLQNTRPLLKALSKCAPPADSDFLNYSAKMSARQLLSRLELIAVIANVYNLHSTEIAAWTAIENFSRRSERIIDEMYGLANRVFVKLRIAEETCLPNTKELQLKINRIRSTLKSRSELLSAYEKLVLTVKLPTPHAHLQCVIVDALMVYVENYENYHAVNSRLDIVLIRHKEFFDSKVWAAVYSRGFVSWLRLRARCSTGGVPEMGTEPNVITSSPLFAAINIKTHGRTLVKFMLNHFEKKLAEKCSDKENQLPNICEDKKQTTAWFDRRLPDGDLVNLWLGTRLLLHGALQVAELYTLLGTVKEARVYQLELLRIAQRFHMPSCAQTAICMMAYTDLLCQRKWAFDLRLSQLNHIIQNKVPLQEIIDYRDKQHLSIQKSCVEGSEECDFLKRRQTNSEKCTEFADEDDYSGMATDALINAAAGGVAELFPTSPMKASSVSTSPSGIPSIESMVKIILRGEKDEEEEGVMKSMVCAYRILNGCLWAWLGEIADFIRVMVVGSDHYFPALIPPTALEDVSAKIEPHGLSAHVYTPATPTLMGGAAYAASSGTAQLSPTSNHRPRPRLFPAPPNAPRKFSNPQPNIDSTSVLSQEIRHDPLTFRRTRKSKIDGDGKYQTVGRPDPSLPPFLGHTQPPKSGYIFGTSEIRAPLHIHTDFQIFKSPKPISPHLKPPINKNTDCEEDPMELCPNAKLRANARRKHNRGASHFSNRQRTSPPPTTTTTCLENPSNEFLSAQSAFADRLYTIYLSLSGLPVPQLLRPVCQWLGLRRLSQDDQNQAARFFGQSVGIAASSLYSSILSSKAKDSIFTTVLPSVYSMAAPNDSSAILTTTTIPATVVQLMLVDELGQLHSFDGIDPEHCTQPAHNFVMGGLGSRQSVYLVVTRWVIGGHNAGFQSRVIHNFSSNGLKNIDAFNEIQTANGDSMQEEDRRKFWSLRFSLDNRLKTLINEIRREWFTLDDIKWIQALDDRKESSIPNQPIILVLDRCLVYLPWEWILWGHNEDFSSSISVPPVCRNFSLSLVVGQLISSTTPIIEFDPHSAFYVLNPEGNLSHTEETFKEYIHQKFTSWTGVVGRMPSAKDVVRGFTQHDLFVYLGHGNGSRFLMSTFDEGLSAKAVALIIGCSSGRPRLEGRHEAYASIFNHLIAGSPTAVSLLWDVTDRDIDRFTQSFLSEWLGERKSNESSLPLCLTGQIFKATNACKLQSLVGKSVVVYGLPAIPHHRK